MSQPQLLEDRCDHVGDLTVEATFNEPKYMNSPILGGSERESKPQQSQPRSRVLFFAKLILLVLSTNQRFASTLRRTLVAGLGSKVYACRAALATLYPLACTQHTLLAF